MGVAIDHTVWTDPFDTFVLDQQLAAVDPTDHTSDNRIKRHSPLARIAKVERTREAEAADWAVDKSKPDLASCLTGIRRQEIEDNFYRASSLAPAAPIQVARLIADAVAVHIQRNGHTPSYPCMTGPVADRNGEQTYFRRAADCIVALTRCYPPNIPKVCSAPVAGASSHSRS